MKKELTLKELYFIEMSLDDYSKIIADLYLRSGNEFYEKKMITLNKIQRKVQSMRLEKYERNNENERQ